MRYSGCARVLDNDNSIEFKCDILAVLGFRQ